MTGCTPSTAGLLGTVAVAAGGLALLGRVRGALVPAPAGDRAGAAARPAAAAGAAGLRPAHDARAAPQAGVGPRAGRRSSRTSSSTPATTWPHLEAVPAVLRRARAAARAPGCVRLRLQRLLRPDAEEPGPLPAPRRRRAVPPATPLPWHDLRDALREAGWVDLTNARGHRQGRAARDRARRRRRPAHAPRPLRRGGRARRPTAPTSPSGVVHAPYHRVLDRMAADGFPLVLAGHTHGGQLRVPVLRRAGDQLRPGPPGRGARPVPAQPTRRLLHVSAGLGTSPYAPVRFACPPEATLLTLVARPEPRPTVWAATLGARLSCPGTSGCSAAW